MPVSNLILFVAMMMVVVRVLSLSTLGVVAVETF